MENQTKERKTFVPTELHGLNSKIILSFLFQSFTSTFEIMCLN